MAEPALIAVCAEAARVAAGAGAIETGETAQNKYALGLRLTVATSVGFAIMVGVVRILKGWPIHWLIIGGYVLVFIQTSLAPRRIVPLAYDSGGVTTSTVTVPLVAALGLGLAETVPGRSPLIDGFGLIASRASFP